MVMKIKKPSQGRQKIAIAKIPKRNNLQVTFSKRRSGLFKKASELCTLCGVEIAIIVFSPANKPFSFGHPEVDSIVDRFLARNPYPNFQAGSTGSTQQLVEVHRNASVHELNMQLTQVVNQLEAEKKCGEALDKISKASEKQCWWERPVEELGFHELQILKASLEELKKNMTKQANGILMESSAAAVANCSSSSSPFFMMNINGVVQGDDLRCFESKIKPTNQHGSAYSFGYAGHGLF
ncbi:agamous-like MADS-box protein AGL62 [Pyrus ussuriensis x Pyrus communis]|uniref:Agamous-like MADS-box protein AGL62 n=1 Tax=Pyrus ussuriensis x Pyrus communis TaxID=2448454 RepID=A0A5N5FC62_9ROSA|nr:agamous-like MADS-box protein AGL62 [Pyrus x bretschneideri]KAB2600665.1 agamous-like MADS-box protein AGL62 [Pyrus ussuriensis x Pyrus communis]